MIMFGLTIAALFILLPIAVFSTILFAIIWISEWLGGVIPVEQYWMVVVAALVIMGIMCKPSRENHD